MNVATPAVKLTEKPGNEWEPTEAKLVAFGLHCIGNLALDRIGIGLANCIFFHIRIVLRWQVASRSVLFWTFPTWRLVRGARYAVLR